MKTEINIAFGRRLSRLRLARGLSQEELAFRCGLHRTYVGAIERGEKSPTLNTVVALAAGLGVDITTLFE